MGFIGMMGNETISHHLIYNVASLLAIVEIIFILISIKLP